MWQEYHYQDASGDHPYFVYTPTTSHPGTAVPLLVLLHGCTQTAADFAAGTGMNALAERYGFLVLYPQQTRMSHRTRCWSWFRSSHQSRGHGEPAPIAHMVQAISEQTSHWTIDSNRVYVVGASAGAAMAIILGATYPDLFAAIGVHSGVEYQAVTNLLSGLRVLRRGGPDPSTQGRRAFEAMGTRWCSNGCRRISWPRRGLYVADFQHPTTTTSGQAPGGYSYTVLTWKDHTGRDVQHYWKIPGLGHAWSGGNPAVAYTDPRGPNASETMYHFCMNHPMGGASRYDLSPWRTLRRVLANPLGLLHIKKEG